MIQGFFAVLDAGWLDGFGFIDHVTGSELWGDNFDNGGSRQEERLLGGAVCHRRGFRRVGNFGCSAVSYFVAGVMSEPEVHDGRWRPRRDAGRKSDFSEEL